MDATKIVPCPKCGVEGESDTPEDHLTCPECGWEWTYIPQNKGETNG